ncbi:hypothetical protein Tco_0761286 [Tanacetum coccineum]
MGILEKSDNDEVLIDDIVSSDNKREESDNTYRLNDTSDLFSKLYFDAQEGNNICTFKKGRECFDKHKPKVYGHKVSELNDISVNNDEEQELLNEGKKLGKNNEAKRTRYNALPRKEYERVFMCKIAEEVWHTLIITDQGNSQVNNCNIDLLTQEYEKFSISHEETIDSSFTRFNAIVTSLKSLDPDYSSKNHVRKFLRALPLKWRAKVTAIEEAKDLATLPLDEVIRNLKVYKIILDNDGVGSKTTKEKVKSLGLKAKVTREQTSDDSDNQGGSDEDIDEEESKAFNLLARNFRKFFRKGNQFGRGNRFGNGGNRFGKGREGHFASECRKPKENKDFIRGAWSDSEDGNEQLNDVTCLMAIDSQEIAQEEEAGIQSTQDEFEFMAADAYEETERVKVNCTLEDTLHQASVYLELSQTMLLSNDAAFDKRLKLVQTISLQTGAPSTRESKGVQTVKVIASRIFRTNHSKTSRVDNVVPNKPVKSSVRTKPITASQPNPARVHSKSKSSCLSNNFEKLEENHRNSLIPKTQKHKSSECNNIKLAIRNAKSEVVCAMCKQCFVTGNHDVCMLNYVNDMNSRADNQSANVSKLENQKKHKANVRKSKELGSQGSLASSRHSKPRNCLRWVPTGRIFAMCGKLTASSNTENKSDKSVCDNASTSNPSKPSSKGFSNSTSLLGRYDSTYAMVELEILIGYLFDELSNGENQVVSKLPLLTAEAVRSNINLNIIDLQKENKELLEFNKDFAKRVEKVLNEKRSLKKENSKLLSKINDLKMEVNKLANDKEVIKPCKTCDVLTKEVDSLKCNFFKLQDEALNFSKFKESSIDLENILSRQKLSEDKEDLGYDRTTFASPNKPIAFVKQSQKEIASTSFVKPITPQTHFANTRGSADRKGLIENVITKTMMEPTMEEYVNKTQGDYYSGITKTIINGKAAYELKGKFLDDLRNNDFSGTNGEDAVDHIENFIMIVDPLDLPNDYKRKGDDQEVLTDEAFSDLEENKEHEIAEIFRIKTDIFNFETPLCTTFNEFNYMLKIDTDLFTHDI